MMLEAAKATDVEPISVSEVVLDRANRTSSSRPRNPPTNAPMGPSGVDPEMPPTESATTRGSTARGSLPYLNLSVGTTRQRGVRSL